MKIFRKFKIVTILIPFCIVLSIEKSFSQTKKQVKSDLNKIKNIEEAKTYSKLHPTWLANIYTISELDTSKRYRKILKAPLMKTFYWYDNKKKINFMAKVVDTVTHSVWDAKYICFDESKLEPSKIDSLIEIVINKYENGEPFDSLFVKYHTGPNPTGKLEMIKEGDLLPELDTKIKEAEVGEVFSVYVPTLKCHFVVIKTIEKRPLKFRKVLVTKFVD